MHVGQRQRRVGRPDNVRPVEIPLVTQRRRAVCHDGERRRATHNDRLIGRLRKNDRRHVGRHDVKRIAQTGVAIAVIRHQHRIGRPVQHGNVPAPDSVGEISGSNGNDTVRSAGERHCAREISDGIIQCVPSVDRDTKRHIGILRRTNHAPREMINLAREPVVIDNRPHTLAAAQRPVDRAAQIHEECLICFDDRIANDFDGLRAGCSQCQRKYHVGGSNISLHQRRICDGNGRGGNHRSHQRSVISQIRINLHA